MTSAKCAALSLGNNFALKRFHQYLDSKPWSSTFNLLCFAGRQLVGFRTKVFWCGSLVWCCHKWVIVLPPVSHTKESITFHWCESTNKHICTGVGVYENTSQKISKAIYGSNVWEKPLMRGLRLLIRPRTGHTGFVWITLRVSLATWGTSLWSFRWIFMC